MNTARRVFGILKRSGTAARNVTLDPAQILAALPLAVAVLNEQDCFVSVNYAAEEFFGSSRALLLDSPLSDILPADHPVFLVLERARHDGLTIAEHDMILESPRMTRRGCSVQAAPLLENPGFVVLTLQDESAARALDQQMSARNAARSITGMAAILAHEVKNPLSGIRGAAQLLETSAPVQDRELAVLIRDEADRIRAMVERMETFGEKKLERQAVNIHRVLEHVRRLAGSGFATNVKFIESYDPSLPHVHGNRDQLIQVLLNLVKNAAEAIAGMDRADGEIHLSTGFQRGVRLTASSGRARANLPLFVAVRDNGPGIPDDIRRHLFEPFISTKATGSGLGLALVAKIVADHGGLIDVDSRPGRTEFRINLPVFEEPSESST
ncbi:two-component system sensor histidine kinase NtrB [Acidocella sp.]|jgi:two-component system nitrogen regulation sensor histidine kinase GlnL|uniref:two-component system sensor histidine kinase NtrB n=1 Tax=Acidocella sp. TaxID=50710 RepID=UPI002F3FF3B5